MLLVGLALLLLGMRSLWTRAAGARAFLGLETADGRRPKAGP
jgi:hypothetical protein